MNGKPNEEIAMERDIKEVVGVLMRALDGGEVSYDDLDDLGFEADGEIETTLNKAYVKPREFANDRKLRLNGPKVDRDMRTALQDCLDKIVGACDHASPWAVGDASLRVAH
jgi:hypothetical protein